MRCRDGETSLLFRRSSFIAAASTSCATAVLRFEALIVPSFFVDAGVVVADRLLMVDLADRLFGVGLVVLSSSVVSSSDPTARRALAAFFRTFCGVI